jgi:GT2 family glycosyltransferase
VEMPHEVIVVDNASPDGSAEMVEQEFPLVQLIKSAVNQGFSPANNLAMERARGNYMLLLNPDTVVMPGALATWIDQHRASGASVSGPRLLNTDGSLQVSAWKVPGFLNSLLELFYLHRVSGVGRYVESRFQGDFTPDFVSGAAMLFDRSVYERIGGLDPEMFWMEDVDLCVRASNAGGMIAYFHAPTIVHIGGQSSKKNMDRVISNQLISRIKFARKHSNAISAAFLIGVIYLHVLTRITAFGLLTAFRPDPRAKAYIYTLGKLNSYLFQGDRSI